MPHPIAAKTMTVVVPTKGHVRKGKMPGARLAFDATKQEKRKMARKKKKMIAIH